MPDEIQVSYDVVALYPSVPIKKAIDAILELINRDIENFQSRTKLNISDIKIMLEVCLNTCYFMWNDTIYTIEDAGPIGLSLMVVMAEGYLQVLEEKAIQDALLNNISLKTYRRYVDDSHARFESKECTIKFLKVLNQQDPQIQYTIEEQSEADQLSFLDVNVINNKKGRYEFKIHRKEAITNVQIKKSSSVNPQLVYGVFKGFLARAIRICSPHHLEQEIKFLIQVFVENGHNEQQLEEIASNYRNTIQEQSEENEEENKDQVICIPWIPKFGPRFRKLAKRRGIKVVFSSGKNLKDILCNHKSPLPKNSYPGVYEIQCGCGATYIGETKKKISNRIKEHERYVFAGNKKMSAVAEHASVCEQQFKWSEAKTVCVQPNWKRRKIREALEIRKQKRTSRDIINRDQGVILKTDLWNPLLAKLNNIDVNHKK